MNNYKSMKNIFLTMIFSFFIISNFNFVSFAQTSGQIPGASSGLNSDADLWRYIRTGNAGSTQMKDELSSVMIQSEGDNWRAVRNGPVS